MLGLLIGNAWAQTASQGVVADSGDAFMKFLPLFLIFGVFYFLLIRPQQKRMDEQEAMIKSLKKGDKIVTGGGIVGVVSKTDEEYLIVEIADGVRIKILRSTVSRMVKSEELSKNETAKN